MEPVMAQVMMSLSDFAAIVVSRCAWSVFLGNDRGSVCAGIRGKAQAPLQRQKLPAEASGKKAPDAFRCKQHDRDGDCPEHQEIEAAEIGESLAQQKEHQGADDRTLDASDATDDGDEDDKRGPVIDAKR